jgi:adenine-specific DNA-methyltransferase
LAKKKSLRVKYQSLVQEELTLFGDTKRTSQLKSFRPFESDRVSSFFDSRHMFGVDRFDIVIANPPYIGEKGNKEIFRVVKNSSLGKRFAQGKMDYFYYFFHLALDVASDRGIICYITTNYFPTATSAKVLRSEFKSRATILKLINFSEFKIFKSALGQHNLITLLSKGSPDSSHLVQSCVTNRQGDADAIALRDILDWSDPETDYFEIPQGDLFRGERIDIVMKGSREIDNVLQKIASAGSSLKQFAKVTEGIQTGANEVYVFEKVPKEFVDDKAVLSLFVKTLHKNSDIRRYVARNSEKKILYIPKGVDMTIYPNVLSYLSLHRSKLAARAQIVRSGQPWYQLLWPRDPETFSAKPKIVAPYRAKENSFFYTEKEFYGSTDTYFLLGKEDFSLKVILACLNSSIGLIWFKNMGKVKGTMLDLTGDNLELFPLPVSAFKQDVIRVIEPLVDKIVLAASRDEFEGNAKQSEEFLSLYKRIDEIVMDVYQLVEDERRVMLAELSV